MVGRFKDKHPEIKIEKINGFGSISIHMYSGVDNQSVWDIAQNDLTLLKTQFISSF